MVVEPQRDFDSMVFLKIIIFLFSVMSSLVVSSAECDPVPVEGVRLEKMGSEKGYISVASLDTRSSDAEAHRLFLNAAELKAKEALVKRVTKLPPDSGYGVGPQIMGIKVLARCVSRGKAVVAVWISPDSVKVARDLKQSLSDSFDLNPTLKPIDSPSLLENWSDDPPILLRRRQEK